MADGESEFCEQLGTVDESIGFLLVIIASVLLSFYSVLIQRRQLVLAECGDTGALEALPDVFPIKWKAGAMVVGALGFFLSLAQRAAGQAECGGSEQSRRSANLNLWASVFVLAAAFLRLYDLWRVHHEQDASVSGDETLPA